VNFLGDEGVERVRQSYGPKKYDQLQALKGKYDPDNFFRLNQNISPNGAEPGNAAGSSKATEAR
jgi:hypothetical protein